MLMLVHPRGKVVLVLLLLLSVCTRVTLFSIHRQISHLYL